MITDKNKFKNKGSGKEMEAQRKSTEASSLGTGNKNSYEKVSISKAELDHGNSEKKSNKEIRKGPSTGGYGDQHEPQRHSGSPGNKMDIKSSGEGHVDEPRSGNYAGNPEKQNHWDSNRSYPHDKSGDADNGSSRSYPSMQSGYGDSPINDRNESDEKKPYEDRGEDKDYEGKGNKFGSPFEEERYEPENRSKTQDQDREPKESSNKYDKGRHLRNSEIEREKGDRDREW